MRNLAFSLVGFTALTAALSGMGCRNAVSEFYDPLTETGGAAGTSGTAGAGGTAGTGGTGVILPPECKGDPSTEPKVVNDDCGIFVDLEAPTSGDGSKAAPFKSVGEAVAEAKKADKLRIFICAGPNSVNYPESKTIELGAGMEMYGGFDACPPGKDWTWGKDQDIHATITGPPDKPAVIVANGTSIIHRVNIVSPDASAAGASSVALVVDGAELTLNEITISTGKGADGASATMPAGNATAGAMGVVGSDACKTLAGGKGGKTMCEDGDSSGGDGGLGGEAPANDGMPGMDGAPLPDPNPDMDGLGGGLKVDGTCKPGVIGKSGALGAAGKAGLDKGTLTVNGISGGHGEDGKVGVRGQGGGGGAGSKSGMFCMGVAGPGASGGGAGAGGCGGKGGPGGKAGGSSVGIVSLSSTLTFKGTVVIRTGTGGNGGNGALGQLGGNGGNGADGGASAGGSSVPGCPGAKGGNGGNGGDGGGGRGGHSVGIAFMGQAPTPDSYAPELGVAGNGGLGGTPGTNDGANGTVDKTLDFNK